jgi:ureidoacrylate peracid hydrolase
VNRSGGALSTPWPLRYIAPDITKWSTAALFFTDRSSPAGRLKFPLGGNDMDPKRTAVVLIEYQNDFTSEGGTLHKAVKPVMDSSNMLANTVETVEKARSMGATIVFAPITFTDDYHELSPQPYGILKGVVDSRSFRKGTWGAEIVDALKPKAEDIVIEGKRGLCGFASTNLDFILRNRGITHIALGGFLTNCCVESTMRTGYEKGYDVVTLTDCTAALSEEEQRLAVEKNYPMFSRPLSHSEFLGELAGETVAAGKPLGNKAA